MPMRRALGEPGGVAVDATPDGRERVIWYYAATARVTRTLESRVETTPRDPVVLDHTEDIEPGASGLYRIVFLDGRVAGIRVPD
jgi:hypothetical protein